MITAAVSVRQPLAVEEILQRIEFKYSALETVICGAAAAGELERQINLLECERVFLVASASLSKATDNFSEIRAVLGDRIVGLFKEVRSHTPREDILVGLQLARAANADVLVSLGGGSIIDASKVIQLALDQDVSTAEELVQYAQSADGSLGSKAGDLSLFKGGSKIRQIAIPTTLSGAEFSNNGGVLNTEISAKEGYRGIDLCPRSIIYDPALSQHTPEWLWFSTAIRSLDHAVEGYCSLEANPYVKGHFLHAMRLFAESLPAVKADSTNLQARSLNQQAVWLSCCALGNLPHGASHGIGYTLGSLCGVPHGYTSCVMLPAVLEWNSANQSLQQLGISEALGMPDQSAAVAVKSLIASLSLPTTLQAVGVEKDQLAAIAAQAIKHPVVRKNPRSLKNAQQVEEILQLAWA